MVEIRSCANNTHGVISHLLNYSFWNLLLVIPHIISHFGAKLEKIHEKIKPLQGLQTKKLLNSCNKNVILPSKGLNYDFRNSKKDIARA
jgi:hypothetical protein